MDKKTICNDLDSIKKKGFRAVIFEAGYKLPFEYLSEEWFKAIRTGVLEAKKRGMKVWIIPSNRSNTMCRSCVHCKSCLRLTAFSVAELRC